MPTSIIRKSILVAVASTAIAWFASTSFALDPTAAATLTNVTETGGALYSFTVKYSDDGPVVDSTLDNNDIRVLGPAGFNVPATFVSLTVNQTGNQVTGTYRFVPPGGTWDSADNGIYDVVMQPGEVTDLLNNPVKAGSLGTFSISVAGGIPAPSRLANISTRLLVEAGDNVLIGGFIITGTEPKKVILRAIGPSLSLSGKLENPTLELYGPGGLITSNDNWQEAPNKQEIIDSTIAPTNVLESAIVATLSANGTGYTGVVRGVNGTTGIAVIEAYDLDASADSKLANISTRGLVQTDPNVLIAGTIIVGSTSQKVIVRAIGPSLSLAGKLADPTLELRDGNGALLESNDNWTQSGNKQAIIDSTVPPTNDLEAAIVRTLAPGNYTAVVRGANNTTGIAVVEAYALN
jgi:hypothetical protein